MKNKAFSLVELSIVILIIGVLVAAVGQGLDLLQDAKVSAARTLTNSSKVSSVRGLVFWLETSMENSFPEGEASDETIISQWNDINPQSSTKFNARAGQRSDANQITYNVAAGATSSNTSGPKYVAKGINNLPTLNFTNNTSASSKFQYLTLDSQSAAMIAPREDLTIFVVLRFISGWGALIDRQCNTSGVASSSCSNTMGSFNFYCGSSWSSTGGTCSTNLRYDGDSTASSLPSFNLTKNIPYLVTFTRDYGKSISVKINGKLQQTLSDTTGASGNYAFKIGRDTSYADENQTFDMSEMIVFSGNVSQSNIASIESYLMKKYNLKP